MMDKVGLRSAEEEGSGNSWEKLLEPGSGTNPQNIAVKIEECRKDGEDFEEDIDTKLELFTINGLLDVKPKVEDNLDFKIKQEPDKWVAINKLKSKNKKMRVDLWLAREKEKKMLEELKSKDEEIEVLKQSVEFWKKKAGSKGQGHQVEEHQEGNQVEEQSQSPRECYVRVNKVKVPSPPCMPPGEASSQAGSLAPSPGGADNGTWEEQEGAAGELEEEQGKSSSHLRRHKLVKTGEKLHRCSTCNKAFLTKNYLKCHLRTHSGEKPYSCDICLSSFSQKNDLKRHKRIHSGEKPYSCVICPSSFLQKYDLKRHNRTHSGEKPYGCDICPSSFSQKHDLKCHKSIHSGEKPYSCDICHKSFSEAGTLKRHKRTHSGEKPFICVICKETFSQKKNMKSHELTHSEKKPHVCQICNKGFIRHDKLKVHKLMHKGKEEYMVGK